MMIGVLLLVPVTVARSDVLVGLPANPGALEPALSEGGSLSASWDSGSCPGRRSS
jgi:hypothetical protein